MYLFKPIRYGSGSPYRELAAYNSAKHSIRTVEPPLVFEDITEDVETVLSNSARMAMMTAEIL
jgi:hypothetical protein